jgi:hypothetical protein
MQRSFPSLNSVSKEENESELGNLPVCATATTSCPVRMEGIQYDWIGVGYLYWHNLTFSSMIG